MGPVFEKCLVMTRRSLAPSALLVAVLLPACGSGPTSAARPTCPAGTVADGLACVSASDPLGREILEVVRADREANDLRAVVFGVRRGDDVLAIGALGESEAGVPATTDMHHRIGNVSAGFLTTTFLQLVDEGKLGTDSLLSEWFPELPAADRITLEMLASSLTGYRHFPDVPEFVEEFYRDPFRTWTADELIAIGTRDGTQFEPGTSWLFSDTNLVILGEVIERVEGRPLGESIAERILTPLGLTNTDSPLTSYLPPPVLHGFTDERGFYEDATFWNPTWNLHSGSMSSNLGDLMTWARALGTGALLPPALFELQTAPRTVGKGPLTESLYYTFGVGVSNGWIVTNPALQGYREIMAYLPVQDLTIVLVTTMNPGADMDVHHATRIFQRLAEILSPANLPALRG